MPLRFSLTTEARILARWRIANEASSVNSALLRTFSLIALFFSRERKGINALDQIYVCPCFNFPNYDVCMECRVVNSTSQIFRVLLWLDERLPQQCAIIGVLSALQGPCKETQMSIGVHCSKPANSLLQILTLTQSFCLSANEFHCLTASVNVWTSVTSLNLPKPKAIAHNTS